MQLGDHRAALRTLALTLGDIRLAEAYCARFTGRDGHLALLDLLLHPGDGRPPLYIEACHLLAAQGTCCGRATSRDGSGSCCIHGFFKSAVVCSISAIYICSLYHPSLAQAPQQDNSVSADPLYWVRFDSSCGQALVCCHLAFNERGEFHCRG